MKLSVGRLAASVLIGAAVWSPGPALAAETATIIVPAEVELAGKQGTFTVSINAVNPTTTPVTVRLTGPAGTDCASVAPQDLAAGTAKALAYTLTESCTRDNDGRMTLRVFVQSDGEVDASRSIVARVKDAPGTDFGPIAWFGPAGLAGALLVLIGWRVAVRAASPMSGASSASTSGSGGSVSTVTDLLPGIESDWSFADSWGSNIGLAAAGFTGLFGATDVLKSVLGDDEASTVAVAVVAAALAAGLIGAGPVVLAVARKGVDRTVGGVLAASLVVISANLGIIATLTALLWERDAINRGLLVTAAVSASVLLGAFTLQSMPVTLVEGAKEPPAPHPSVDAVLIARAIGATTPSSSPPATSPGDSPRRRVSAML